MKRFEIWLANIPERNDSHVQYGRRPVIIISNDQANIHSPVITAVPLTTRLKKTALPTHVFVRGQGLDRDGLALCEQILTLDKFRLVRRIGFIYKDFDRAAICHALAVQLAMAA